MTTSQRAERIVELAPSVLPCDFGRLGEELGALEEAGVDRIHWDVMDGVFVPNITIGAPVIASCRRYSTLPYEVHLMIVDPERYVSEFVEAGCELITVHAEATRHLHRTLSLIKSFGVRAGVALNPATPLTDVEYVMDQLDVLMIMSVNPGFGGQHYIEAMDAKILAAVALREATNPLVKIEVDGGVSEETIQACVINGAEVLVSGSALMAHRGHLAEAVEHFHQLARDVHPQRPTST
ncbi:ribulose-phosphate 3-epimerase [Ferrimicrobium sp.]|uniref:ribulose-phosphate 3-epimerase n=1 Tax=Ferrimicrobium sp. TaxID=2926050 RepID=UPI0026085991|nr:ribulose-phosphate 3-epimerase [Ferrimicrobium sp.]